MKRIVLILALMAMGGCATVNYCDEGGHEMVDVANSGWYLLNVIPLFSGNPEHPNTVDFKLFRQTTTLENNVRMLDYAATERGAVGVKGISTFTSDEAILFILFKHHVIHTSAELVMPEGEEVDREQWTVDRRGGEGERE